MSENKAELKEQLKIQKDHSRRNNIRVDGIEEDDNQTLEDTENKLKSFLYDKLKITEEYIYIEREPRAIVPKLVPKFDYEEKEELMAL